MRPSRPTIADIARAAGVSKGAVSFALNGRPGVSESTRRRILEVAERMSWRPHSAARALSGDRAGAVGLVLARPARTLGIEPFFMQLLSGMQSALSADGVAVQLMIVEDTAAEIATYRRWAGERRVDGLILVDPQVDDRRIQVVQELAIPAVLLGGDGTEDLPSVWVDDREAMLSIVEHLAGLGHRHIAHVAGLPDFQHTRRRIDALRDGVAAHRLPAAVSVPTDFSDTEGAAATRGLLDRTPTPTAIIYDSDVMSVAGFGVAVECGLSVPADLSIVSFDDSRLTQLTQPPVAALSNNPQEFGAQAARLLAGLIESSDGVTSIRMPTPVLTVRGSTGPPAGGVSRLRR